MSMSTPTSTLLLEKLSINAQRESLQRVAKPLAVGDSPRRAASRAPAG
jgi:hypothetical protein